MPRELQLSDVWGVVIALGAFVVLLNWRAVWGWARMVMSRLWKVAPADAGTQSVHVPVEDTSMNSRYINSALAGMAPAIADTSAADDGTETPRLSRRLSDTELIALLSVQRGKDNRYRFSANQITQLVGGSRAEVLNQVRAIRDTPPPVLFPDPENGGRVPASYPVSGRRS